MGNRWAYRGSSKPGQTAAPASRGRCGSTKGKPPSFRPALRPQHFYLLAESHEFGVDRPRPRHYYNVAAAFCPYQQRPDELTQAPLDSIADHGVAELPADGEADTRPAHPIIADEEGKVLGGRAPAGSERPIEVAGTQQA